MGMMNDMQDKMGDMNDMDKMRDEMRKLQDQEKDGSITDEGRDKLSELRARFANH